MSRPQHGITHKYVGMIIITRFNCFLSHEIISMIFIILAELHEHQLITKLFSLIKIQILDNLMKTYNL